ncbi:hypothetical protein PR202_ga00749 [Eleusine coracana subsp. coracana]|uniref:Uncharacterized protein n=1 Tax=Eleusine coracana subsp. coracana TaxID=191504 RepID=A0AAV5BEU3_ELECO|nr:hypothetical protein PR202_ga00749 [Eleusine coracana subsp. coracana]
MRQDNWVLIELDDGGLGRFLTVRAQRQLEVTCGGDGLDATASLSALSSLETEMSGVSSRWTGNLMRAAWSFNSQTILPV